MPEVLFRADGGRGIGAGHLTRCLALAQAGRRRGWHCALLTRPDSAPPLGWRDFDVRHLPPTEAGSATDLQATRTLARELAADWIVADGYRFQPDYLATLQATARLLLVDDLAERDPPCQLVLNPNVGAEQRHAGHYRQAAGRLLGADYFLLRPEIRTAITQPEARRVLVSFGADDAENLALSFVRLAAERGLAASADVVCTGGGVDLEELRRVAARAPGDWRVHAGPLEIAPFMARAEVVVCAGGGTAGEAASLGVPAVIVVRADNQRPGAQALARAGAASLAGEGAAAVPAAVEQLTELLADDARREVMARCGRALIDGHGAERVVARMEERL